MEALWERWISLSVRLVGLGLIIYEALTQAHPRDALLLLYGSMIGLPEIIRYGRRRSSGDEPGGRGTDKPGTRSRGR